MTGAKQSIGVLFNNMGLCRSRFAARLRDVRYGANESDNCKTCAAT